MKTMIETMTDAKIETLNKMAEAILGKKLQGWTITNAAVEVIKNGCWTTLKLVAVATNGQETTKFFYEAGRPLNQLAKFAEGLL